MILKYKKVHPKAKSPYFATPDAACFDLVASSRGDVEGNSRIYGIGLSFDIPKGYFVEIAIRSGLAFKDDFILANGVGIIDADFTGEVKCKLRYCGEGHPNWPIPGERIAQGRLVKLVKTEIQETEEVKETQRGENGFGSTGR